ncbi:MAG: hypothetical protein PHV37_06445 [Candidatus Gastranaerophilales bacterium]|nr:hypothetical protein [Candidatus Gastranaerophilales bacterium]
MSLPVSNLNNQPVQQSNTQPEPPKNIAPQIAAPTPADPVAAKKIQENTAKATEGMALAKPNIGSVAPPDDMYQYSVNQDLTNKYNKAKEIRQQNPLASSSLAGGNQKSGGGFFKNLLLLAGAATGIVFAAKKFKLSKVASEGITGAKGLKNHLDEIINQTKSSSLKAFNLKKSSIRVTDEAAKDVKDILATTRKIATEARNVEGKTPKIIIKLKEGAGDAQKVIKEAISKNKIHGLPNDILKKIEYIDLDYVASDKKSTDILIETLTSKFTDTAAPMGEGLGKFGKFIKDFLND